MSDLSFWEKLNVGYARAMRDSPPEIAELVSQACEVQSQAELESVMTTLKGVSSKLQREGAEYLRKRGVTPKMGEFDTDAIEEDFITNVLGREMPQEGDVDSP